MRWSSFTRTSSSVRAASMPSALSADREGGRDDRIDVLLATRRVVDAVVADLGRVTRGDLVDAQLCAAHRGGGRGGRLAADGQRPADEVGADRLPRGTGDAERVADVARVVDRAGDDLGGQDDRDADRQKAEEELREGETAAADRHGPDD